MSTRRERDSLGPVEVPARAYHGAQTRRAVENFPISGIRPSPHLVHAYAEIKRAAARVNARLGLLPKAVAAAVERAADEVLSGKLAAEFVVDAFQAGAGTSLHMNVNEVLANRAGEILGDPLGSYRRVHPNDHVNLGQSTNDTFPSATRIAILAAHAPLRAELDALEKAFRSKGRAFRDVVTAGRTHLMDATPITHGRVFRAYGETVRGGARHLEAAARPLGALSLGGTAVGTGLNAPPRFRRAVIRELAGRTGLPLRPTPDPVAAAQTAQDFAAYAGALKTVALDLVKIAGDIRLLASGPTSGLAEIRLPAVQPGSSIMPGKVNPVLAEALTMVAFHVAGAEGAVALAAQRGEFQLNVFWPLIAHEILFAQEILTNALRGFRERCVAGIEANPRRARAYAERTVSLATALNPIVGYARAAEIVHRALAEERSVVAVAAEVLGVPESEARRLLDPLRLARGGLVAPRARARPGRAPAARGRKRGGGR